MHRLRILILGGTTEAAALARLLAGQGWAVPLLSLAGRTRAPVLPPIPHRIGGFGGIDGLAAFLRDARMQAVIDATHPYAVRIAANAVGACRISNVPLLAVHRPAWTAQAGDRWMVVPDLPAAARALGAVPRRVFLTVGRQDLAPFRDAPQHRYLIRSVEPPPPDLLPPEATIITARGPFDAAAEAALLRDRGIDVVVTKNAGGAATYGKIAAARACGCPVIITERPARPAAVSVATAEAALDWLRARHATLRGA